MILYFKDGTTQWIYRLKSPEFTTATYNLAEGKVITGIEVIDELTQQNISSGSIYLNSIDFYKSSNVIASTMFSILQLDHNIIQLPSSQLLGQFYGRALENVSTVILTSDPPQDLGKALDWVQKGGNLMIMGGLTNGYFSNLLGIKPVPVAQLNVSSVVNTVSAENGDAIKIPSIIVPQINAENANSPLYFTNLDTKQSTPFGFYKKIGNGTIYFVITDPILSTIENLSNSNIHLLESMLNLTMNTFNLQIPSHVSSMGTFPDYNTVDGNIILNGNATIVSNYIDSTEQIPTGTVKITSENINAEFRNSTIESLSAYGEATLLVNDSSELSTISGSPSPSTIILTSNESAECAIILSNKTNVELNIEDSYGENHSITVEDGTVYFNSNKLSLLLENPTVEVTGETLFKSLAVHIAPYTLLAGALNNVNIEGSCAFKMDYVGGGSALISNFVYDGTAKKLVYPSSSQQELEIPWIAIFFSPLNALTIMCLAILFAVNEMRRSGTMSRLRMKRQVKCGRK